MTRQKQENFDPQAIPHYNSDGRLGELDRDEPEERESSAQSEAGTVQPPDRIARGGRTPGAGGARGGAQAPADDAEPIARGQVPRKGGPTS
jgi:hypothetical protein